MIIIVFGLPGSGKSYFAERLALKIGAVYLNSDRVRKELEATPGYSMEERLKIYEILLEKTKEAKRIATGVVIDASFFSHNLRKQFAESFPGCFFILVEASEEIIRERVNRKRTFTDADFNVYLKLKSSFEPVQHTHLKLSSDQNDVDAMISTALEYINHDRSTN
ncbi:MAG: AAA family ATPase [Cytophagaceae bacterium]